MEFEWDETKRRGNLNKHGVDFVDAVYVFLDRDAIVVPDLRHDYGELRLLAIGMVARVVLTAVFTDRENQRRIVSARRASRRERQGYDALRT